tara:strand:+ start:78 stop:272 length:195 start_codon:yes stop_codon:yes gene_type:complete
MRKPNYYCIDSVSSEFKKSIQDLESIKSDLDILEMDDVVKSLKRLNQMLQSKENASQIVFTTVI